MTEKPDVCERCNVDDGRPTTFVSYPDRHLEFLTQEFALCKECLQKAIDRIDAGEVEDET